MPAPEVVIDGPMVQRLLASQHPDLAGLDLAVAAEGWDNVMFRLGPDLAVRLPRRAAAAPLVEHEQRWLPVLAPDLPLAVPAPVRTGRPGEGYPWAWSVTPWLRGSHAADVPPADPVAAAADLGRFLAALHVPAPTDAPANPFRGVPLAARDASVREFVDRLGGEIDRVAALDRWDAALAIPTWAGPAVWLHGDLHPANLLVSDGRITAVIDFGDITAGDPATDLAVAWMLLPAPARPTLRAAAGGVDDDTWARARGWALLHGLACLANSADNPLIRRVGRQSYDAVVADRDGDRRD